MVRAGLLHTIQQKLAADPLATAAGGGTPKRHAGAPGAGQKHVPLMLRAKEPAVEERQLKLAAAKEAAAAAAAAAAGGGSGAAEAAAQPAGAAS